MTTQKRQKCKIRQRRLGQYFTPDWVVDYIMKQTLGPALNEDPDRLLGEFTVLDPACGDGAFLLGALRFLSHKVEYLPSHPRSLILRSIVDSIHGIDVDRKAIHSCQNRLEEMSKKLLGVSTDFSQRILLGNSLIQTDVHSSTIFGNDLPKLHPVDWHRVYPWAMRDGGFDAIIGNPPFLGIKAMDPPMKEYIRQRYRTVYQQFDILVAFIELGLQLLRPGGRLGYVISNKVLAADYGTRLRQTLVSNFIIEQMVDLSHLNVFEDAATYPHIIVIRKPRSSDEIRHNKTRLLSPPTHPEDLTAPTAKFTDLPQQYFRSLPNTILAPTLSEDKFAVLQTMLKNTIPLGQACNIRCGIAKTGFTKRLLSFEEFNHLSKSKKQQTLPFLNAGDVQRYRLRQQKYLTYIAKLTSPEQWQDFQGPKLIIAGLAKQLRVALDQNGHALGRVYYITQNQAPYNPYFLLALLNSRLINAYFTLLFVATHLRSGYIRYNASYLGKIPLAKPTQHQEDELAELATFVLQNPKNLKKGLDQEIDCLVAKLYGLSISDVILLEG